MGGAAMPSNALTGTVFQVDASGCGGNNGTLWRYPITLLAQHQRSHYRTRPDGNLSVGSPRL